MGEGRDWRLFFCSCFFVLGFSVVFSLVGVLLQSVLVNVSYQVQQWLARIGGVIIILFGLYLVGLLKIPWLEREHKVRITRQFTSSYAASFAFGAAFAVGWTPCVGAVLGTVLTLAATQPTTAFFLLVAYTLGLGLPFLIVGLFSTQATGWIEKAGPWLKYVTIFFGAFLLLLGVFVFTNNLSKVANIAAATTFLQAIDAGGYGGGQALSFGVAFIAGLVSFLSPCVLPLIPAFLTYLASIAVKK